MNFVRSMPAPQLGCTFGYGEQMNQITSLHDGSNVYGSDKEDEESLRENRGGLLKTYKPEEDTDRTLLPQEDGESKDECEIDETQQDLENRKCFKAGEIVIIAVTRIILGIKDITVSVTKRLAELNVQVDIVKRP